MTIVGALRGRLYRGEIARRSSAHEDPAAAEQRESVQLAFLNREWARGC